MGRAVMRPSLAAAVLAVSLVTLAAQAATVRTERDQIHVRVPGFSFIRGEPLARLKDGRSVRVEIALSVHARPGDPGVAQTRASFDLSYDLWDERFAVTLAGSPAQSVSYLTARDAEAWCLDRVTVPLAAIGRLGRDAPLWIHLEYLVNDETDGMGNGGVTLRGLIDRLSRRREASDLRGAMDAGPLMLTN
jgi:hypothetical protein